MNLETFFEKFDQFAYAPDAVAKMRELVLQLAVTGKLATQDKRDEPASALLESTEAERAKLVAAKRIKSRPTSHVEPDDQPFDLPSSWAWARLSDVGYELGQKVPDKPFTYIDVGGIDSDKGRISDRVEKLEADDAPSRARKLVTRGTVIYSTVRPYLLNIAIVDEDFDPAPIASTAFAILHPFAGINNRYLFYWLRSAPFTAYVEAGMKGMAYPAINDEKFYSGPIALPPLAEQKRIVAKVDELMALCDRLEAQQQERETRHGALARASLARFSDAPTPDNLEFLFHKSYDISPADLRKSILTLAVQGKLVPRNPNDEPAEADFNSLVRTRENSPLKRTKIDGEATAEDPLIPDSWLGVCLGELVSIRTGFAFKSGDYTEQGTFILRVTNINPDGSFDTSNAVYLPDDKLDDKMRGFLLDENELLVVMVGGSLGKIGQVTAEILPALLNQNMWRLKPYSDRLDYRFLRLVLHDLNENRLQITPSTHGHLAMGTYAAAKVPFPPLAEQRRIVAKVDELMDLVDALETQLATARTTATNLLAAAIAELTNGKEPDALAEV